MEGWGVGMLGTRGLRVSWKRSSEASREQEDKVC